MHKYLAPALAAVLLAGTSFAAEERPLDKPTFTSAAQADLSPDLKPLAFLEGTWDVEQRLVVPQRNGQNGMSAGEAVRMEHAQDHIAKPEQGFRAQSGSGPVMKGTFRVRRGLAGRALVGRFESEGPDGHGFFGHMVLTAEKRRVAGKEQPEATTFTSYWADSMGITSFTRDVAWEDDTLTLQASDRFGDMQGEARVSYRKLDENRIEFNMELKQNGQWQKFSTATYTRSESDKKR